MDKIYIEKKSEMVLRIDGPVIDGLWLCYDENTIDSKEILLY